ncbi:hypothetical protein QJS10_CPA07g00878 [Acorus calamus]|uniref:RING-type domain-containing protein n=1 Tax=Acorus calamus TaxID=4465 RepID=A0AAV9EGV9_ACOCL|nr:hypothetical protein QJS10_CPA07g00878 [Acorus calamus]
METMDEELEELLLLDNLNACRPLDACRGDSPNEICCKRINNEIPKGCATACSKLKECGHPEHLKNCSNIWCPRCSICPRCK